MFAYIKFGIQPTLCLYVIELLIFQDQQVFFSSKYVIHIHICIENNHCLHIKFGVLLIPKKLNSSLQPSKLIARHLSCPSCLPRRQMLRGRALFLLEGHCSCAWSIATFSWKHVSSQKRASKIIRNLKIALLTTFLLQFTFIKSL